MLLERKRSEGDAGCGHIAGGGSSRDDGRIAQPIDHSDVTTIMSLLVDVRDDIREIRRILEDDDAEEEDDADQQLDELLT